MVSVKVLREIRNDINGSLIPATIANKLVNESTVDAKTLIHEYLNEWSEGLTVLATALIEYFNPQPTYYIFTDQQIDVDKVRNAISRFLWQGTKEAKEEVEPYFEYIKTKFSTSAFTYIYPYFRTPCYECMVAFKKYNYKTKAVCVKYPFTKVPAFLEHYDGIGIILTVGTLKRDLVWALPGMSENIKNEIDKYIEQRCVE